VDWMLLLKAAVMGVVEGLTEFLPISSTGHLIITASLIDFPQASAATFGISIQSGAMLAVLWEYRQRFADTLSGLSHDRRAQRFALNVLVAFIPAVVLGLAFGDWIKAHLFHAVPVAIALIAGGFVILWAERRHKRLYGERDLEGQRQARVETVDDVAPLDALKVGLLQCLALIPGTSRSGAIIIGALVIGFSRKAAAEFSFFLGVPTLMGAGAYSLWLQRAALQWSDLPMYAVGVATAFVAALLCIRWLIRFVSTHDFVPFAWYRIVFGGVVLLTAWAGWVEW